MLKLNNMRESFFLIAGPCVIEDTESPLRIAEKILKITADLEIPFIFKASYKKANRSRLDSFTGIGDEKALSVIEKIGETLGVKTITDIHSEMEARMAADVVDFLQIPAFLCRQTELLVAAGKTGRGVNIKKGQFIAPDQMRFAAEKVASTGNNNIMLTERGSFFGYGDLVVDMRSIPVMKSFNYPVALDVTHSLQQPNSSKGVSGGLPKFIETIAKAGVAVGADGIFLETHPSPQNALSDGANMLPLDELEPLLVKLKRIYSSL
ncbi:MAG: 3-deoxy-8-phosphooctulonate synthase [Bacteroidales bacterium]|nr:3-deoxy-8-phosphooctulonate synthase [Bacteroidales bacterium]